MSTKNQLVWKCRWPKKFKNRVPALKGNPQKRGVCIKVIIKAPKKPNSAKWKVSKLKLSTRAKIESYIPGEGHNIRQYSNVLVRGGRVPDLPGVLYHNIRGKYDLQGVKTWKTSRSRYGTKKTMSQY